MNVKCNGKYHCVMAIKNGININVENLLSDQQKYMLHFKMKLYTDKTSSQTCFQTISYIDEERMRFSKIVYSLLIDLKNKTL